MKLILFSGFLGSGKTSLILSLAHYIVDKKNAEDEPALVIIENEIGEIGIDEKVLNASGGFEIRELFSGCICCQISVDLITTLNDVAESIQPEWVIIESTGLAYPGKILETINRYAKGISRVLTISVVDAERWEMLLEMTPFIVQEQIKDGDSILINKIDLLTEKEILSIEQSVSEINPHSRLKKVSAESGIDDSIWEGVLGIHGEP